MQTATSSGGAEQHRDHVLLDGQRGVVGSLCPGVSQDSLGAGVDDDRGVRTMPRQRDAAFKPVRLHAAVLTSGWAAC